MGKQAHIVAISTASLGDLGWGVSSHPTEALTIMDMAEVWIGPRPKLEVDFNFVQPIPYVLVKRGGKYLAYTRAKTGNEGRLHDKLSIGFGGHVDLMDAVVDADTGIVDLFETMQRACRRELREELGLEFNREQAYQATRFTHVISSHASEVDRVHIGFVATIDLDAINDEADFRFEKEIGNATFMSVAELSATTKPLENWTALVLSTLDDSAAN